MHAKQKRTSQQGQRVESVLLKHGGNPTGAVQKYGALCSRFQTSWGKPGSRRQEEQRPWAFQAGIHSFQ